MVVWWVVYRELWLPLRSDGQGRSRGTCPCTHFIRVEPWRYNITRIGGVDRGLAAASCCVLSLKDWYLDILAVCNSLGYRDCLLLSEA